MTHETWGQVRGALRNAVGENNYSAWIDPINFGHLEDRTAQFYVPTNFHGSWVSQNYGDVILRHLISAGVGVDRIVFIVGPRDVAAAGNANTAPVNAAPAQAAGAPANPGGLAGGLKSNGGGSDDLPGGTLNAAYTFDNFVVGKPNELAHAAARRVAEGREVTFNPLFLYGGVGLGKTHLMHAIAWELRGRFPEARILYLSAEQFMYRFVRALREQDTISFKTLFRSVDVLMVDDVQFISGKRSTQEEFFHTFNALIDEGKQIIISGDKSPADMEDLDTRIASRLQCGLVVDLHPTDYELRLGVLQHKAEQLVLRNPQIRLGDGVLEFMARKIATNIRVVEGGLTRLFAFADLVRREITIEMVQDCLADILRQSDRKVTLDQIIKTACEYYNLRQADLIGSSRARAVARPRQMVMYLSKTMTTRSYPEIARKLGKRDHTTVLYGVRKIEELMTMDSQIAEDAAILRRMLSE